MVNKQIPENLVGKSRKSGWKVAGLLYDILGNWSGIFFCGRNVPNGNSYSIFQSSFRPSRLFFGKWNWFVQTGLFTKFRTGKSRSGIALTVQYIYRSIHLKTDGKAWNWYQISQRAGRGDLIFLPFLGCEILNSVTPALFLPFPTLLELLPLTRLSSPACRTPPSAYSPRLPLPLSPTLNWVTLHY